MPFDAALYAAAGYLLGSILFAQCFGQLFHKKDMLENSPDKNPGTYNAFRYGGFLCGWLTLCCDLLKGFLPVHLFLRAFPSAYSSDSLAFVMAAPVLGHIAPVFFRFRGGKGVAVTFGCLLGLLPFRLPLMILAGAFLFFSLVVKISPNYYRTLFTYLCSAVLMWLAVPLFSVKLGFLLICGAVACRLLRSREQKEKCRVEVAWKH